MPSQIERFAVAVMSNRPLQSALMELWSPKDFSEKAHASARSLNLPLDEDDIRPASKAQVLLHMLPELPLPPAGWLPVRLSEENGILTLEWMCFDGIDVDAPFFPEAIQQARHRPFNQLFKWRTRLSDTAAAIKTQSPAGFIFHVSRCGSTLVHRMLAASEMVTSLSEVPLFDQAVRYCLRQEAQSAPYPDLLRVIVAALGNMQNGKLLVLKLVTPHILSWQLICRTFPESPAIVLYRNPVEVLVSQQRIRGFPGIPQPDIAALCGMPNYTAYTLDEYYAHFMAACCRAASQAVSQGAMRAINYRSLPAAVHGIIFQHFGLYPDSSLSARIQAVTEFHSKSPNERFIFDSNEKSAAADATLHALAENIVAPSYRELELAESVYTR